VCGLCRDGYVDDVRQAATDLTTAYLEVPDVTIEELAPGFLALIEALDGLGYKRRFLLSPDRPIEGVGGQTP
jgi:hypothetical protein